jgi:hypothetical protein
MLIEGRDEWLFAEGEEGSHQQREQQKRPGRPAPVRGSMITAVPGDHWGILPT